MKRYLKQKIKYLLISIICLFLSAVSEYAENFAYAAGQGIIGFKQELK